MIRTHDDDPDAVETDPTDALQNALAGEHAAVYAYGLIAGRLDALTPVQRQAASAFALHRKRRDDLVATLVHDGQEPVPAEPAYAMGPVQDVASAREVAQQLESSLCAAWAAVVGPAGGAVRAYAVAALSESATALLAWRGTPSALPGLETDQT